MTQVDFQTNSISLKYGGPDGTDQGIEINLELANEIDPAHSEKQATSKKIEIKLKKVLEGASWMQVEKGGKQVLMATSSQNIDAKPSYPTSSKNGQKDWNKIDKDIQKELN